MRKGLTLIGTKGFTLIEMVVVITIIGVLASVSFVSFSSIQRSARDTKRQSDLKVIQSALEQYRADQSNYPVSLTFGSPLKNPQGDKTYINIIPNDPRTAPTYVYTSRPAGCDNNSAAGSCSSYCIYAKVENDSSKNTLPPTCDPLNNYNYTVTPL